MKKENKENLYIEKLTDFCKKMNEAFFEAKVKSPKPYPWNMLRYVMSFSEKQAEAVWLKLCKLSRTNKGIINIPSVLCLSVNTDCTVCDYGGKLECGHRDRHAKMKKRIGTKIEYANDIITSGALRESVMSDIVSKIT